LPTYLAVVKMGYIHFELYAAFSKKGFSCLFGFHGIRLFAPLYSNI